MLCSSENRLYRWNHQKWTIAKLMDIMWKLSQKSWAGLLQSMETSSEICLSPLEMVKLSLQAVFKIIKVCTNTLLPHFKNAFKMERILFLKQIKCMSHRLKVISILKQFFPKKKHHYKKIFSKNWGLKSFKLV